MSHAQVSSERLEGGRVPEDFVYQAEPFVNLNVTEGGFRVGQCDSAGLLSTVLECAQAIVDGGCDTVAVKVVDAEDATLFV